MIRDSDRPIQSLLQVVGGQGQTDNKPRRVITHSAQAAARHGSGAPRGRRSRFGRRHRGAPCAHSPSWRRRRGRAPRPSRWACVVVPVPGQHVMTVTTAGCQNRLKRYNSPHGSLVQPRASCPHRGHRSDSQEPSVRPMAARTPGHSGFSLPSDWTHTRACLGRVRSHCAIGHDRE